MTSPEVDASASSRVAGRRSTEGRNTHGVAALGDLVQDRVHAAFPHRIWVTGDVADVRRQPDGGLRFTLQDGAPRPRRLACLLPVAVVPDLRDLLLRDHDAEVRDIVVEGRHARVGGLLRYSFDGDALALTVSDLDPAPTAERLEQLRAEACAAAVTDDAGAAQRSLAPVTAPLRVGVIGLTDDERAHRAAGRLTSSPFRVQVELTQVAPEHGSSRADIATAIAAAARRSDVVLLLRGEGRPLTLSVFDAGEVVRAVAQAPVPVLTGLGGRGQQSAADVAAAASHRTADAAVDDVLGRLLAAGTRLAALGRQVSDAEAEALGRARTALAAAARVVQELALSAQARAATAARRRNRVVAGAAGALAVAVVVTALALERPVLLLALVLPALLLAALRGPLPTLWNRSHPMEPGTATFDDVLARLEQIRAELGASSRPEDVARLRAEADDLVARGEQLLQRTEPAGEPTVRTVDAADPTPPTEAPDPAVGGPR